jgi:hypothetical protein
MNIHANALPERPPRLSRRRELVVYGIAGGVWLTGAVWLLLRYFFTSEGEFGRAPHPLEFWSLATHGAFAFLSLWLFGLLWGVHIPSGWRSHRRRWTGSLLFALFAWLSVSGYLLYYLGDERLRDAAILLHWVVGLPGPAAFLAHRFATDPASKLLK